MRGTVISAGKGKKIAIPEKVVRRKTLRACLCVKT